MKAWRREFTGKHRGKEEEFSLRAAESAGEIKGHLIPYAALMEVLRGKCPLILGTVQQKLVCLLSMLVVT